LRCDFGLHANPRDPEMGKARPVVVVARPTNGLSVVVPISTKEPLVLKSWHCELDHSQWPPNLRNPCWAKCDMLLTVADWRLDRYYRRDQYGKRKYMPLRVTDDDFTSVTQGILAALAFST
jgi:uncharacterized protein YifN (PemK superfamily)